MGPRRGFTLVELILVMALLAIILALSAPALSRFFKGRNLDLEARRFMALTREAQSRAVSEGVPMVLWLQPKQLAYGLNADRTFVETDPREEQFTVDSSLQVRVIRGMNASAASQTNLFQNEKMDTAELITLRFNPDGFISPTSPETVVFQQSEQDELWVKQSRNRLNYEIVPGQSSSARR